MAASSSGGDMVLMFQYPHHPHHCTMLPTIQLRADIPQVSILYDLRINQNPRFIMLVFSFTMYD